MGMKASNFGVWSPDAVLAWAQVRTLWRRFPGQAGVLCVISSPPCTVCSLRVAFLESGAQGEW